MTDPFTAVWRKSSFSNGGGECVEIAALTGGRFAVRDSKAPGMGALVVITRAGMTVLLTGCKAGQFGGQA